jgi:hypothetical protein
VHEQHRKEIALLRAPEIDSPAIVVDRVERTEDAETGRRVRPMLGAAW